MEMGRRIESLEAKIDDVLGLLSEVRASGGL
jgi:hypothetical protein